MSKNAHGSGFYQRQRQRGASRILEALVAANRGSAAAYGADEWSRRAEQALARLFETDVSAFLVATGTAANALALSSALAPWGAALCHQFAHIAADECGAPEFFAAGAKLVGLPGDGGKLTPDAVADALALMPRGVVKQVQPMALSLSQATECGTVYTRDELADLSGRPTTPASPCTWTGRVSPTLSRRSAVRRRR